MTDFQTAVSGPLSRDDVPEPFYGQCWARTHPQNWLNSAFMWVGLDDGTMISQPEYFRREGVCCWTGLHEKHRKAER